MTATMPDRATEWVQPILLARAGTHEDAIEAAARASVLAFRDDYDTGNPAWAAWLADRFTKTVRRASTSHFTLAGDEATGHAESGDAAAVAYPPVQYQSLPHLVRKSQVQGTDYERTGWTTWTDAPGEHEPSDIFPILVLNPVVADAMSTGKTAAQAAHATFAFMVLLDPQARTTWLNNDAPFQIVQAPDAASFDLFATRARVAITDAGLTEIAPGTTTFLVL
jgi:hypothetical protein